MIADGLAAFWWACCYLPERDSTACWLAWERLAACPVIWRRA